MEQWKPLNIAGRSKLVKPYWEAFGLISTKTEHVHSMTQQYTHEEYISLSKAMYNDIRSGTTCNRPKLEAS